MKTLSNKRLCYYILGCLFLFIPSLKAQNKQGISLLPGGLKELHYTGTGTEKTIIKKVTVQNQPFKHGLSINTFNQPTGEKGLKANITQSLKKGDVLWISFHARCLTSKRETGESFVELRVDRLINGKYVWPPYLERGISFGQEWTETSIPFVVEEDIKPEDIQVVIKFDSYPQHFEMGPITFINYENRISSTELPRTVIKYEGSEPEAPWRKEAAERIEKLRKGNLSIKVTDSQGNAIDKAEVSARLKHIDFNWGTATSSQRILDSLQIDSQIYRDTLSRYFNQVVFENEMKWKVWCNQPDDKKGVSTLLALRWLRERNIPARGHVMVWPSWQHSPPFLKTLAHDTCLLRSTILDNIRQQTNYMRGQFEEWDVINEPYAHHDFMDILGRKEMVDWFQAARKGAPGVKLFLNDYTMFHSEEASHAFYENVKYLQEQGAPIEGIGEQAHIGGTPPGIPKVLERLDKFSIFGLPITITEFDINSNDEMFQAQYLGDFMTAIFSHPSTTGFVQWGFWEGQHWFPIAALWNKDWSVRPHGKVFTDLVSRQWTTQYEGITKQGACSFRGFCGEYEITVNYKGTQVTHTAFLTNEGNEITIKFSN